MKVHVPGSLPDRYGRDDAVVRRIDRHHRTVAAVGNVNARTVAAHRETVGECARLDGRKHLAARDVDHVNGALDLARDIRDA